MKNRPTWKPTAKQVIAQFRADSARYPGDSSITGLIEELLETSDTFLEEWSRYDVQELFNGNKQIYHPSFGMKEVGQVTLQVPNNLHIKIVILTNVPLISI
ncbi:hypothetical protein [Shimazuella alba]|uniref:MmyB-like transcription regulator ligand binding domain-containing protein n=1 Tax=Shimazuella alba TaxID=2690964 RepID=A0A6I4VU63_9BACL|nr:hypothetical protein [Shimazuella alba]